MARTIGIDLGTTYTCAAIVRDKRPEVIRSRLGYTTIPSVVTFSEDGAPIVGHPAERQMTLNSADTVYGSKRLLGRPFGPGVLGEFQPHFLYQLIEDEDGLVGARVGGNKVSFTDVAALILDECRRAAEDAIGGPVRRAVVTVPAHFTDSQRACVRLAGEKANLEVVRVVNEPTAAALSYGVRNKRDARVLVFDLGGGTFDVSIVAVRGNLYEVQATGGDNFLGGIDFDQFLVDYLLERITADRDDDVELSPADRERLRKAAQQAKHELSEQTSTAIQVPNIDFGNNQSVDVSETVTRADFEKATEALVEHCIEVVVRTMERAKLGPADIDDVLLVGGQTRMPLVRERLTALFGKPPRKDVHPDEVVALGAAIAADAVDRADAPMLRDAVPVSIGLASDDGVFHKLIPGNTPLPHSVTATIPVAAGASTATVYLFQGESPHASNNDYLGAVVMSEIGGDGPRQCALRFDLDRECLIALTGSAPDWEAERILTPNPRVHPPAAAARAPRPTLDPTKPKRKRRRLVARILRRLKRRAGTE